MITIVTEPLSPGDHARFVDSDGRVRNYLVHIPPQYDQARQTPIVLAFHGGGSNAEQMAKFCGLNGTADKHGFIVVYPERHGTYPCGPVLERRQLLRLRHGEKNR